MGEPLPVASRLNPERVIDLWPNCLKVKVVSVFQNQSTYVYEHVGDGLRSIYGNDMSGKVSTSKMRDLPGWQMLKKIDEAIANPKVIIEEGQFVSVRSNIVKFRACILPFGVGEKVTHIVVGMSYKEF